MICYIQLELINGRDMHHSMTFYWSSDIGDFFFNGLTINTPGAFSALCIVLVALSIVYEAMKVKTAPIFYYSHIEALDTPIAPIHSAQVNSAKVRARAARERLRATSCAPSETANLLVTEQQPANTDRCFSRRTLKLLGEAVVFLLHNTLGYALMLSVMIYNGYLFVMVVLGMGAGYFLFGHISMRVNMENMQARTVKVLCSPMCPPSEGKQYICLNRVTQKSDRIKLLYLFDLFCLGEAKKNIFKTTTDKHSCRPTKSDHCAPTASCDNAVRVGLRHFITLHPLHISRLDLKIINFIR